MKWGRGSCLIRELCKLEEIKNSLRNSLINWVWWVAWNYNKKDTNKARESYLFKLMSIKNPFVFSLEFWNVHQLGICVLNCSRGLKGILGAGGMGLNCIKASRHKSKQYQSNVHNFHVHQNQNFCIQPLSGFWQFNAKDWYLIVIIYFRSIKI